MPDDSLGEILRQMTQNELTNDVIERSLAATGKHIVFFDGVCGLCNKSVQLVLDNDKQGIFRYASLQSNFASQTLAKYGVDAADLDSIRVLADYATDREQLYTRSDAALFVLRQLGGGLAVIGSLTWIPRFIRDCAYKCVASIRYALFGKTDTCRLPDPETRSRFIEV